MTQDTQALTIVPATSTRWSGGPKARARRAAPRGWSAPISMSFGWTATGDRKDAVAFARGWADRHLDARERSYYAVDAAAGGFLYEIHEGGSAHSYLPAVAMALRSSDFVWIRDGDRAWTFKSEDERIVVRRQSARDSAKAFGRETCEAAPSRRRLRDVVWKGRSALVAGLGLMLSGGAFYSGTLMMTGALSEPPAPVARLAADQLPYRQWPRLSGIPLTRYVETLKFSDGHWGDPVLRQIERHRSTPTPLEILTDDPQRQNSHDPPPPPATVPIAVAPASTGGGGTKTIPVPVTLPIGGTAGRTLPATKPPAPFSQSREPLGGPRPPRPRTSPGGALVPPPGSDVPNFRTEPSR